MNNSHQTKSGRFAPQIRTPKQIEDSEMISDITSRYDKFINKQSDMNEEDIQDTPEAQVVNTGYSNQVSGKKLNYGTDFKTKKDQLISQESSNLWNNRETIELPKLNGEMKTLIGPSNRWGNIQTHYETMNNKENFGGDIDDIEEMSEFVEENSKFIYSSEEESLNQENY